MKSGSERRGPSSPTDSADAETISLGQPTGEDVGPTALYVTGPHGGSRHLLPPTGIARIGRGVDNTVAVDDPGISRSHVAIRPVAPFAVTDLGSANGTFIGRTRLVPGQAHGIAFGETFFVGRTALALRPSGLVLPHPDRMPTLEQLAGYLGGRSSTANPPRTQTTTTTAGHAAGNGTLLLRVRVTRAADHRWLSRVLGELLVGPGDWLVHPAGPEVVLGISASSRADAPTLERDALARLGGWSITATAESSFVPGDEAQDIVNGVVALLRGSGDVRLRRGDIIVRDPAMETLRTTLTRVATTPLSLLVLGETGVGKDIVASMVHEFSQRADKPFLRVNCTSLPDGLMENELFGHERGAFTGADSARPGLLESANGGTVFFDEIGDLALPLQAKLLHVIESCEITRLGGVQVRRVDVRFVAATNRPLDRDVETGRFRRDLYHRLNGVSVTVPPLRRRRSEIEPLARHFLARVCDRFDLPAADLSPAAVGSLLAYPWPGNVRELRNVVERAALLATEPVLQPHHLGLPSSSPGPDADGSDAGTGTVAGAVDHDVTAPQVDRGSSDDRPLLDRAAIEDALIKSGGNQSRAAEMLGIARRTLIRRIIQLGLPRPRKSGH